MVAIATLLKCGADASLKDKRGRTGIGSSLLYTLTPPITTPPALDVARGARNPADAVKLLEQVSL